MVNLRVGRTVTQDVTNQSAHGISPIPLLHSKIIRFLFCVIINVFLTYSLGITSLDQLLCQLEPCLQHRDSALKHDAAVEVWVREKSRERVGEGMVPALSAASTNSIHLFVLPPPSPLLMFSHQLIYCLPWWFLNCIVIALNQQLKWHLY